MSEANKAVARRPFDEVWNESNLDAIDDIFAPDVVNHGTPPGFPAGAEGAKAYFGMFMRAFPDTRMTVEDQIAEGDKVMTRWTANGTHTGELMGIQPTGKQVTVTGLNCDRIEGGRIVESWGEFDELGLLQQIGAVPRPGG